jgi:hypothetical protein
MLGPHPAVHDRADPVSGIDGHDAFRIGVGPLGPGGPRAVSTGRGEPPGRISRRGTVPREAKGDGSKNQSGG